jgi:hypothetical protein
MVPQKMENSEIFFLGKPAPNFNVVCSNLQLISSRSGAVYRQFVIPWFKERLLNPEKEKRTRKPRSTGKTQRVTKD